MNNITEKNINEKIICPNCASLTVANSVICYVCNGFINNISTIDPVQNVFEQRRSYRNLSKSKSKLIVLIGTWIMLFPCFTIGVDSPIYILLIRIGGCFGNFIIF